MHCKFEGTLTLDPDEVRHRFEPQLPAVTTPSRETEVAGGSIVTVAPAPYVTVRLAASITGLTEKAIRRRIEEGKWIEGREYRRSPDGGIFISLKGFVRWVEGRA